MDGGGITIGNDVFIGPSCGFYTAHHPLTPKERNAGLELAHRLLLEIIFGLVAMSLSHLV